LVTLHHWSNSH